MTDPLVSIILPTYDRLPLLRESVDSVRAQTFAAWELIVLDDGSTDGTAGYLERLAREDPRVRPVPLPHTANLAHLRNTGVSMARGRWIAFQDSDDLWAPAKLQRHLDAHAASPEARWSYSNRQIMDAAGTVLPDERFVPWRPVSGWIYDALLMHQALIAIPSVVAERALLEEIGGSDETLRYCQDFDLELRLAARAPCIAVEEPLVRIRQHGSWTRGKPEVDEHFIRVYQKHAAQRPGPVAERLCRHQQAYYALWAARKRMQTGDRSAAARWFLFALRMRPASLAPWRLLGGGVLRRLGLRS